MVRVKGITLKVRRGRNNVYTEAVRTLRTGKDGSYAVKGLEAGNYCLEMVCGAESGYIPSYFNIVVLGNETVRNQNGVLSSKLSENQVRIVLTWGGGGETHGSGLAFVFPAVAGGRRTCLLPESGVLGRGRNDLCAGCG